MPMVKITNGVEEFIVTDGGFHNFYEPIGFREVTNDNDPVEAPHGVTDDGSSLLEKPVSEWTDAELKNFAHDNMVGLKGIKTREGVEEVVSKYLLENGLQ